MVGDKYAPPPSPPLYTFVRFFKHLTAQIQDSLRPILYQTFETYKFQYGQSVCASLYEHIKLQNVTVVREVWGEDFSKKEKGYD